ncbi:MAG: SdpI family protein [bacterium]
MKNKTTVISAIGIILLNIIFLLFVYPSLPNKLATHWDINGVVNGYMDKDIGILFIPILAIALMLLLFFIPKLDPKYSNIKKFQGTYNIFILGLLIFLFYINGITILSNLGYNINMMQLMIPALSSLIFLLGILIEKSESNYTIGFRTPWTLSNSKVWDKTHKLGAKLFKISAIITLLTVFIPSIGIYLFLITIISVSIFLTIYSYLQSRKL